MAVAPNIPNLPIDSFSANVKEALGKLNEIDLRMLVGWEPSQKGKSYHIKSWKPKQAYDTGTQTYIGQEALDRPIRDAMTRRVWEGLQEAEKTIANDLKRRTPHQDIDEYMTISKPNPVETGHEFETLDELETANDPTSRTIQGLAYGFVIKRQRQVINGMAAQTVNRLVGETSDVVDFDTAAPHNTYKTKNAGFISFKDDFANIRAIADAANVPDKSRLCMLINPFDAADMCTNSFDKMFSIDFVEKKHVEAGTLPDAFGIHVIKSNLLPRGRALCWLPQALAYVPYEPMWQRLAEDPTFRYNAVYYARETGDCKRIDDLGVIRVNIQGGAFDTTEEESGG